MLWMTNLLVSERCHEIPGGFFLSPFFDVTVHRKASRPAVFQETPAGFGGHREKKHRKASAWVDLVGTPQVY
jgi:hypothetical protein